MLFNDPEDDPDLIHSAEDFEPDASAQGLASPRASTFVLGHAAIEQQLLNLYTSGKFPHALVLAGPEGIGKSNLAFRLAKFLLSQPPVEDSGPSLFGAPEPAPTPASLNSDADGQGARLVISGGHPDLLVIERELDEAKGKQKDSVSVDSVRKVAPFLQMTPFMGGWRIVIIDDADTMTRASQNALLKVLEEPPANALLILIAHRPGNLIPTIRSRSRYIDFTPLSQSDFNALLKQAMPNVSAAELAALYNIAGGSIGHALRLMQGGALKAFDQVTKLLAPWPSLSWTDIHLMAELLGGKGSDDSLVGFQDVLLWTCEQIVKTRARGAASMPKPLDSGPYPAMLSSYTLEQWSKICENLKEHFATVKYGTLDKRHAVFGAFTILQNK